MLDGKSTVLALPQPVNRTEDKLKRIRCRTLLLLILGMGGAAPVFAQPIERVKISDNDLSCRQIHDELGQMDAIIRAAQEKQKSAETSTTAAQAGGVAAEVASRTGLFGKIGGLFGHIAGTAAAKTAAGVAEQSAQKEAQAAKEEESQALARKEHLTALFLAKGCKASDPDAPAANPNATVAPPPQSAAAPMPIDEVIRQATAQATAITGELDFKAGGRSVDVSRQRVFIPNYRVAFVIKTVAEAYGGGALANFGSHTASPLGTRTITQSQNKRVEMALAGADQALLQALTDKLYADFVARLKSAGKEVVSWDEVQKTPGFEKIKFTEAKPYTKSPWASGDKRSYLVLTPTAMPLFFLGGESHLSDRIVDLDTDRAVAEIAARLDAIALIPTVLVDIAQIESSGRSVFRAGAEADVLPKLGIANFSLLRVSDGRDAKIFYHGEVRLHRVEKPFYIDGEFGAVKTVDQFDTAGLANVLTAMTGTQGAQHFVEKRELRIDPVKYATGVVRLGALFNDKALAAMQK